MKIGYFDTSHAFAWTRTDHVHFDPDPYSTTDQDAKHEQPEGFAVVPAANVIAGAAPADNVVISMVGDQMLSSNYALEVAEGRLCHHQSRHHLPARNWGHHP